MIRSAALALLLLLSSAALAQGDPFARGIDLVPIKFTPTMDSGLSIEGAELQHHRSWQLQAILDLNVGILALKLGDQHLGDLVPFRADVHLMGAYQVHPRIELSGDLPIAIQAANFNLLTQNGFPQESPRVIGIGAPRFIARAQLISQKDIPLLGLAAVAEVRLPIGDTFSFLSDRGLVFAPRLTAERSFGPVRVLANLGWRLRTAPGQYLNLFVGQEFMSGVGGVLDMPSIKLPVVGMLSNNELLAEVNLATPAESPFTFKDAESLKTPFELLIGARTQIKNEWGVMLAFGRGLGLQSGYGRETFRMTLGVTWQHYAEPDQDNDGIPDSRDACIDVPEDKDGFEDLDGCPEPGPDLDSDGDGIPDSVDGCPTEAGPGALDGCPDRDGDQIPDNVDKCPDVPGIPDLEGCPPPEDEEPVVLESERVRIKNQILFEFGSDRIDPSSFPLLDEVAKVLNDNRDVGPVLIEGHTDNVGARAYNIDLSRRRAKAVEKYLVTKNVKATRLRSDGFGFDRPIVPNDSAINRAKNRRTEFRLVQQEEPPEAPPAPEAAPAPAPAPRPAPAPNNPPPAPAPKP